MEEGILVLLVFWFLNQESLIPKGNKNERIEIFYVTYLRKQGMNEVNWIRKMDIGEGERKREREREREREVETWSWRSESIKVLEKEVVWTRGENKREKILKKNTQSWDGYNQRERQTQKEVDWRS